MRNSRHNRLTVEKLAADSGRIFGGSNFPSKAPNPSSGPPAPWLTRSMEVELGQATNLWRASEYGTLDGCQRGDAPHQL
jgi:hypothetical protein